MYNFQSIWYIIALLGTALDEINTGTAPIDEQRRINYSGGELAGGARSQQQIVNRSGL
jgi:hypothetical protein